MGQTCNYEVIETSSVSLGAPSAVSLTDTQLYVVNTTHTYARAFNE
jgi:hypothetical protein